MSSRERGGVLLVNPRTLGPGAGRFPLSLLSLAAHLEGRHRVKILDGNVVSDLEREVLGCLSRETFDLFGVTVMPGPQVPPAIAISCAVRKAQPATPIAWGGYFPTLYPDSALRAPYVDYVIRGQGEESLAELLDRIATTGTRADSEGLCEGYEIPGTSCKVAGEIVHRTDRHFRPPASFPALPYHLLDSVEPYLHPSFLGKRTGVYQAAIGCRYRCEFCGVVSMFQGTTRLQTADRLREELCFQRDRFGVDGVQLYDHNFFDTEESSIPLLEAMVDVGLPWWCYARTDTLAGFSAATWKLIRKSRLAMTYMGAEASSDEALKAMRKGTRVEQTFEVTRLCEEHGVIPELSFIVGGPQDPDDEMQSTFRMIRRLKRRHPSAEIIIYVYTPTPQLHSGETLDISLPDGSPMALPSTPEEWSEKAWVDFVCHQDSPWLTKRRKRRLRDFRTVLSSRYPTVQDPRLSTSSRWLLENLARLRWATGIYAMPLELRAAGRLLRLRQPQRESI